MGKPNLIYVKNFADPRFRNRGKNDSGNADSEVQDAAAFLGVLALVGLTAGGGIYAFMKQKQKKQAEKEALDPDADYTEDKGDFDIPTDVPDEDEAPDESDTEPI